MTMLVTLDMIWVHSARIVNENAVGTDFISVCEVLLGILEIRLLRNVAVHFVAPISNYSIFTNLEIRLGFKRLEEQSRRGEEKIPFHREKQYIPQLGRPTICTSSDQRCGREPESQFRRRAMKYNKEKYSLEILVEVVLSSSKFGFELATILLFRRPRFVWS